MYNGYKKSFLVLNIGIAMLLVIIIRSIESKKIEDSCGVEPNTECSMESMENEQIEESRGIEQNNRYMCIAVEEGFEVTFFDSTHEIIFSECYPMEPAINQVADNVFEVSISVGSPATYVFYIDMVNAEISETFFNPLFIEARYIAYMEDSELILRDVFNDDLLCMAISRDFTKTANPMSAIISVKMQDKNTIKLSYYKGDNYEETSEIITIP